MFKKISFENKILAGYLANLAVVFALGIVYWSRLQHVPDLLLDWITTVLIILSLIMLTVVYLIFKNQIKEKNKAENRLEENKKLLQSILDNTTNVISVKKINGEYILINKQYGVLFNFDEEQIKGKTEHDLLPKEIADKYREADLEVLKKGKEVHVEEIIKQVDGPHTYLSVKFPLFDSLNRIYAVGTISTDITERNLVLESFATADAFFNMSHDMLIIASNSTFLKVNPATIKTLGYTEKELLGQPFLEFVHPEDVNTTLNEVEKLKAGAITVNFVNRYLCSDGSYKWINWTTYPDVKTGLLYAVARDVSINKEFELNLRAADTFFNMSLDLLMIASKDKFVKINAAVIKSLGYTESELLSKSFLDLIFTEDLSITEKTIEKLQKGTPFINIKNRVVCKDGSVKWLSWSAVFDTQTGLFYNVARDVTEQVKLEQKEKEAMEETYENEQKLTLILENIGDGVLIADSHRNVLLANYMANKLFGVDDDSKIPVNFTDRFELFFPDEKTIFPIQNLPMERALKGEITDDIDVVLLNPTSFEKKRVLLSGRPIIDLQKNIIAAVITIKDISKYKMMEQELLENRKIIGFKKGTDEVK